MPTERFNKYRAAVEALQRGRDQLVDDLADEILDQGDELLENNFLFNEFLENQGTRLHFLTLVLGQLEQSAEAFDEMAAAAPPSPSPSSRKPAAEPARKRRPRAKKMPHKASAEGTGDDL